MAMSSIAINAHRLKSKQTNTAGQTISSQQEHLKENHQVGHKKVKGVITKTLASLSQSVSGSERLTRTLPLCYKKHRWKAIKRLLQFNHSSAQRRRHSVLTPRRRHHLAELQKREALGRGVPFAATTPERRTGGMPAADSGRVGAGLPRNPSRKPPAPKRLKSAAGAGDHPASEPGAGDQQLHQKKKESHSRRR